MNYSLIKLWGKYEKIYENYVIKSQKTKIINHFKEYNNDNLLNNIKNDFLQNDRFLFTKQKRLLKFTDNSISINICYNKKHEIEILYEKLLVLFKNNPSIKPNDVIVTSTDIDTYTSYIYSTFTSIDQKKQIPFFIAQDVNKKHKIIILSLKKILNLSNSRFENSEILELLDIPEIADKFNISDEEIRILYSWIEETNIRWAIDDKHKDNLSFPKNKQNTWLYGIEKLLLSYSMNNTKNVWDNILSSSYVNGSRAELISKLIVFIQKLKEWRKKLSRSQNIKFWSSLVHDTIDNFFSYSEHTEKYFKMIKKKWAEIINANILSCYSNKISIHILTILFFNKLDFIDYQKFFPCAINFCHPTSVCYIPFKIICVIGADHQSVPRENYLDNCNLLKKYSSLGDFNSYEKHCYVFLQSLACAEKHFYISYVGYSIKDESKIYSSILVDQLLQYITLNFYLIRNDDLNFNDNAKRIIKHLCKTHKKKRFYKIKKINNNHTVKEFIYKYKSININLNSKNDLNENFFNNINLKNLIDFWKHPIRYFFNLHLNIKFHNNKKSIEKTEPFSVNTLDSFKIKTILLKNIIHNQDTNQLFQYYLSSGKLPYGTFGKIFWEKSIEDMQSIARLIIPLRKDTQEKNIYLKIKKYYIQGKLSEIQDTGLLRWKPNAINYSDRISLWLEHLIYCASGGIGESKIIGYKKNIWSFVFLDPDTAHFYLLKYVQGYVEGTKKIILLTQSGAAWLDVVYDVKKNIIKQDELTKQKGKKKLFQNWIGNNFCQGEKNDFYIHKTFLMLNEYNVKKICKTAQKWLIPILKYKK